MPRWTSSRWIAALAALLVAQFALAIVLSVSSQRQSAVAPPRALTDVDTKTIDRLVVDGPMGGAPAEGDAAGKAKAAASTELVRKDAHWVLPGAFGAPADGAKVGALLEKLSGMRYGAPVATSDDALRRFKVADDAYERHLVASASGKPVVDLRLGGATALRKSAMRLGAGHAVYAVDLSEFDLPTASGEWLDPALLKIDAAGLTRIDDDSAKASVVLERSVPKESADATGGQGKRAEAGAVAMPAAAPWQAVSGAPHGASLNPAHAKALAELLARMHYDGVLGTAAQADWNQDQPALRLVLTSAKGAPVTWTLSKPKVGDDYVLKASDQPWYLRVKAYAARPLLDAADPAKLFAADAAPTPPIAANPHH